MNLEDILLQIVTPILGGIVTFITGGGLLKVIMEIKKNGRKANWNEIIKEVKRSFKTDRKKKRKLKKLQKALDKEIKTLDKDQ